MSGYLEVKYPFKTNLYPFKTWKRQWCILRPSPTCSAGGSLAVYCSEAGASAGAVELPPDSVVRLAKSRSRPHAFAVFSLMEPHKPRILLAAQTFQDAQIWMDKIRALLDGRQVLGTELLKDSYSVTIITTALARKLGLNGDGVLSLSAAGALISRTQKLDTLIEWKHIRGTTQTIDTYKNKICVVNLHSSYQGGGSLKLSTPVADELASALRQQVEGRMTSSKRLSRSEGDLRRSTAEDDLGDVRRSSWSTGGPAEVALDDTDLLMMKESKRIPSGQLSRCAAAGHLPSAPATPATSATPATPATPVIPPPPAPTPQRSRLVASATIDDCMSDRRSLLSIASGIYEEIPDLPDSLYTKMTRDVVDGSKASQCNRAKCTSHCDGGKYIKCDAPKSISLCDWGKCSYQRDGEKCSSQCDGAKPKCSFQCDKGMFTSQLEGEANSDKCSAGVSKCARVSVEEAIRLEEPTYESVAECVYATMRRTGKRCPPPPLPPRLPFGTMKLGSSWNSRMNSPGDGVTRHSSLGSLPRCCSVSSASSADSHSHKTKTLPKDRTRQAFSVFRKRLKSDSRVMSPKSETAKENKHVETKKKKFDFTPTRDIFKNFKVSRKMKNLKITPGSLSKAGETKSCEFLDETEHVTAARCSKSVECLEGTDEFVDEFDGDLSLEFNDDAVAALALPQEIMELILRSEHLNQIRSKTQMNEGDYMPMSPIVPPPPIEHHYITMSPRTNLA